MKQAEEAFIGLGSNIGDRLSHLRWATSELDNHESILIEQTSRVYESEAHVLDDVPQPAYLNAVVKIKTTLYPLELLAVLHALERNQGRRREDERRWASRTLDLDVLSMGRRTLQSENLILPHPRLNQRTFVLTPWGDIDPDYSVPAPFNLTIGALKERCRDNGGFETTDYRLLD